MPRQINLSERLEKFVGLLEMLSMDELKQIANDLFTPQEVVAFADRIEIIEQLLKGKTQRQVANEMQISVTTVNRGARVLKFGSGKIKQLLQ